MRLGDLVRHRMRLAKTTIQLRYTILTLLVVCVLWITSLSISPPSASPQGIGAANGLSEAVGPVCALVNIGSTQFWTPNVMADSPYLGTVTGSATVSNYGSYTFSDGIDTITSSNSASSTATVTESGGNAAAQFELNTWYIYRSHYTTSGGWCSNSYVARVGTGNQYTGALSLTCYPNYCPVSDDSYLVNQLQFNGVTSITFHNGFSQNDGTVYTCGTGPWNWDVTQRTLTQEAVSVGFQFSFNGGVLSGTATGTLGLTWDSSSSSGTSFAYNIPGNSGTYYYDNLDGSGVGPISGALSWKYAGSCGGGGGGCVLAGTSIMMADRTTTPVQDLKPGDKVLSWDVSHNRPVVTTVTSVYPTYVASLIDVNNGLLYASGANDQPVYAQLPGQSPGWVLVGDLTVGSALFDPLSHAWIPVTSLTTVNGSYQATYDVATEPAQFNNYIANGLLLDRKA